MKTIIFDFDGTIGDSLKVVIEIGHQLTHRPELVQPEEIVRLRKLRLIHVAKDLGIAKWRWPYLMLRGRQLMSKQIDRVLPFPGIIQTLHSLHDDGYQLFIMSSNSSRNIDSFIASNKLQNLFQNVYGGAGLLNKAAVLKKILRDNALTPHTVLYVGDEPRDIKASHQVGISCVAVSWGYNAPELLIDQSPKAVADTPEALYAILQDWGQDL